jgi:hypothetical protein
MVVLGSNHRNAPITRRHNPEYSVRPDPPNYTIFRANKTIAAEASLAGWQGTFKRFVEVDPLVEILTAPISATPNFKWLSRIQIDFDLL